MPKTRRTVRTVPGRVAALGRLGLALQGLLPRELPRGFVENELSYQARFVVGGNSPLRSCLERVAVSLLCCRVPLQVQSSGREAAALADMALRPLPRRIPKELFLGKRGDGSPTYPGRQGTGLRSKSLVRFGDVLRDVRRGNRIIARRFEALSGYTGGFYDDQSCSVLLIALALQGKVSDPVALAIRMVLDMQGCKDLNVALKGSGLNATQLGCILCEGDTLQGKGSGSLDLKEKAGERVRAPGSAGSIPNIPADQLVESIREVLRTELKGRQVSFPDKEEFWDRRWQWAVNGGHSKLVERGRPELATGLKGRLHRRAALEEWSDDVTEGWDGRTCVSASVKYECGKRRMILACDTVSYVAFEHMLRPIEKMWRNERVLLDPGVYGHYGVCKRVRDLQQGGGDIWLMVDYDDFNSQHSLEAQKSVIREAGLITGYDRDSLDQLVDSFDKMDIFVGDKEIGRATATLMSGHRATTFINSILNAAYIRCAIGRAWDSGKSMHTGDDVVFSLKTFSEVDDILRRVASAGLRINPLKQSAGTVVAEFLRVASTKRGARGYLCRAVAAATSGSWVEGEVLRAGESATTLVQLSRTMANRSGSYMLSRALKTCFGRRTGVGGELAERILVGDAVIGAGPCYRSGARVEEVDVGWPEPELGCGLKSSVSGRATSDYLCKGASAIETEALQMLGTSVVEQMLQASYGKTLEAPLTASEDLSRLGVSSKVRVVYGSILASGLRLRKSEGGILTKYPLLNLLRSRLRRDQVIHLIRQTGNPVEHDIEVQAWGPEVSSCCINGVLSYSDASHFCSLTKIGVIDVDYPVAV